MNNLVFLIAAVLSVSVGKETRADSKISEILSYGKERADFINLTKMCDRYGTENSAHNLEVSVDNFLDCFLEEVMKPVPTAGDATRDNITLVCSFANELSHCFFDNVYVALQDCVGPDERDENSLANLTIATVDFFCEDDGAQDRLLTFINEGWSCIELKNDELSTCFSDAGFYDPPEQGQENNDDSLESDCREISDLYNCVRSELVTCPQPVAVNYLDNFITKVNTVFPQCVEFQTTESAAEEN